MLPATTWGCIWHPSRRAASMRATHSGIRLDGALSALANQPPMRRTCLPDRPAYLILGGLRRWMSHVSHLFCNLSAASDVFFFCSPLNNTPAGDISGTAGHQHKTKHLKWDTKWDASGTRAWTSRTRLLVGFGRGPP